MDEAKRVIAHWNKTFGGVRGAKRANPADACNVKAYVKMLRLRDKSDGLFSFDEAVVCAAITAYARARYNVQLASWKHFSDWICCENVDALAAEARITAHSAAQPRAAKTKEGQWVVKARAVLEHQGICRIMVLTHTTKMKLPALLAKMYLDGHPVKTRMLDLTARRDALSTEDRAALGDRARRCFDTYFQRPFGQQSTDAALSEGIALALLDLTPGESPGAKEAPP